MGVVGLERYIEEKVPEGAKDISVLEEITEWKKYEKR